MSTIKIAFLEKGWAGWCTAHPLQGRTVLLPVLVTPLVLVAASYQSVPLSADSQVEILQSSIIIKQ